VRAAIFEDLFVLELANNHWGKLERGLKIINDFSKVVRFNNVRAAVKLQFRDVNSFVHKDHRHREDVRYIKKTITTHMSWEELHTLNNAVRTSGMITMATPFDEFSVDKCVEFGVQILKLASSDIRDWVLIEKIACTGKPVIASTGGASLRDMDDLVSFFNKRSIPFALNHCVSLYPSKNSEL
jgi:sialic acid synthase SpsE